MTQSALILLDLQNGIFDMIQDDTSDYFTRVSQTSKAARAANIPIIYVKTSFRSHHPEISPRNKSFSQIASFGGFVDGNASVQISAKVAPLEQDIIVTKKRVSAFSGSDLACVLSGLDVKKLVLAGVATSGAVLSTVRQAADLDYDITVVEDLCLDRDEEVHRVLVEKVFPRQARVIKSEEWVKDIGSSEKKTEGN
jgi:nicotinamidase-related amidase